MQKETTCVTLKKNILAKEKGGEEKKEQKGRKRKKLIPKYYNKCEINIVTSSRKDIYFQI